MKRKKEVRGLLALVTKLTDGPCYGEEAER